MPGKTITDDVNETYYGPSRKIAKNVSFEEITLTILLFSKYKGKNKILALCIRFNDSS